MSESKTHDVAIIGCGLMGAAIARSFASSGYSVAAWNRTPERAEALAGDGVEPVRSIGDVVRSSRLVVACVATYETTQSALDSVDSWDGTTLVNVGTGSPDEVEDMERWATKRGARYLDGAIFCFPQHIGTPDGRICYSGSPAVWAEHEEILMSLAESSRYISEQARAASVLDTGTVGAFYVTAVGAYIEAATYMLSQGVSADVLRENTLLALETLKHSTEEAVAAIESGDYDTDQATLATYAEGTHTCLAVLRRAGHRARILAAATENLDAAEAAGLGDQGIYAQSKVVADPGAH